MPYQISYRGLTVTCSDASELDQLADRLERKQPVSPSTVREAVSKIGPSGKQLLKVVSEQQNPISQAHLAKQMNLNEAQLPGPLTAISKRMKEAGFKLSDVLIAGPNGSGRERMYVLAPGVREEVRVGITN